MNVQEFPQSRKVAFERVEHQPTYDAQHLAQAVDVPEQEVAKTVLLKLNGGPLLRGRSASGVPTS